MSLSRRLHDKMVKNVLNSKISFFEENPQGRIVNRFSKDIYTLDMVVFGFLEMIDYILKCMISLVLVVTVSHWLLLVTLLSFLYLVYIRKKCLILTSDPMRLKFALMSPVNSLIQDAVNGLPTLRCMNQKQYFLNKLYKDTDLQTRAHVTSNGGMRWAALRIDF